MASNVRADNAVGQLLICLRMSNLNFVVNETPYSAYITVRKKFINSMSREIFANKKVNNVHEVNQFERENELLKARIKELEKECGLVILECEEFEVKYEALEDENKFIRSNTSRCFF